MEQILSNRLSFVSTKPKIPFQHFLSSFAFTDVSLKLYILRKRRETLFFSFLTLIYFFPTYLIEIVERSLSRIYQDLCNNNPQ